MATEQARTWINSRTNRRPNGWSRPRLTPKQRDDIRQRVANGEDLQSLALEYGVTAWTIRHNAT